MSEALPVKQQIARSAHVGSFEEYQRLHRESLEDPAGFWGKQAELLSWFHPFHTVTDGDFGAVDFGWFLGGRLNASYNCVDRHLATRGDKTAIIWAKDEAGEYERISYRQLYREVGRVANVLRRPGVKKGARVCISLPMVPELAYCMLACARIGAIHSVVFAGFSAESLRDRILDAHRKLLSPADEGLRGGKKIPLKETSDQPIAVLEFVGNVLVVRRTGA